MSVTVAEILTQLVNEGHTLPPEYEQRLAELPAIAPPASRSPWYVRLFVGVTAWLAALFLVAFIVFTLLDGEEGALIAGVIFCATAVMLNFFLSPTDFWSQLGLALSMTGQILFLIGLISQFDIVSTALGMILLEVFLFGAYNDSLHRTLSTLVILGSILTVLVDSGLYQLVQMFTAGLAGVVVALQYGEKELRRMGVADMFLPATYGCALFLLGLLMMPLIDDFFAWGGWWQVTMLLLVILVLLIIFIAHDLKIEVGRGVVAWFLVGCLLLFVPGIRMPGVLGALILLLLGFWRRNYLQFAAVFLLFFIGAYYYSLQLTLLTKSFTLMGSGAIMFLLWYLLQRLTQRGVA